MPISQKKSLFSRLISCLKWDKAFIVLLLTISLPIMLQQLVTASLHIIDGLMVSNLGDISYVAVTQASRISWFFTLLLFGIGTGCAIFISQFWGAKDIARIRQSMGIALILAVTLSGIVIFGAYCFPRKLISFFLKEGESFELAVVYLQTVAPSYLFLSIDAVFSTSIKAVEKTKYPMISSVISILTNTILNYVLIFGNFGFPAFGVKGAALATTIAAFISMLLNIYFAYSKKLPAGASFKQFFSFDFSFFKKFLKTILPVIANEGTWALGIIMYSVVYGKMGTVAVATTGIITIISDLMWVGIFALMNATSILVGKALGENNPDKAYLYAKRLVTGSVVLSLVIGTILILIRGPLVGIFSGLSLEVKDMAQTLLILTGLSMWFRTFNTINIVGVLRSGGDTVFSLVLDASALWLISIPLMALAALVWHWSLPWVYAMTLVEEFIKMAIGFPRFKNKKWIKNITI